MTVVEDLIYSVDVQFENMFTKNQGRIFFGFNLFLNSSWWEHESKDQEQDIQSIMYFLLFYSKSIQSKQSQNNDSAPDFFCNCSWEEHMGRDQGKATSKLWLTVQFSL